MKKMIAVLLSVMMLILAFPAAGFADGGVFGQLKYSVVDNKVVITGTTDPTDDHDSIIDIEIPDQINGLPVVEIGNNAFYRCAKMKSIVLPETIERIGDFAFCFCTSLEAIVLPEGLKYIGNGAFGECASLTELIVPDGLETLGDNVFLGCTGLKTISIPSQFFNLPGLFRSLSSIEKIDISGTGLTEIPNEFFSGMKSLTEVDLPDGLQRIGESAFSGCTSLKTIHIPDSVTTIEMKAFANSGIEEIDLPEGLEKIESSLFYNCTSLKKVTVPKMVGVIGNDAFCQCSSLEEINLPGVRVISEFAFLRCSSLKKLFISDAVVNIMTGAFEECGALSDIYYDGNMATWNEHVGNSFEEFNVNVHYKIPFTDIPNKKWYTEAVVYCFENSYMSGVGGDSFDPNGMFTRAMFVQVLAKIDGFNLSPFTGTSFNDVKEGKWYSKAVQWAYTMGYTSGTGNNQFSPNGNVTRQEIAQFFYNYSKMMGFDVSQTADLSKYTDKNKISNWAVDAVSWAVAVGLISGMTETTLSPKDNATRAQVAVMIKKYVTTIYSNGNVLTRNGLRAEPGAYFISSTYTGGAFLRIFKNADNDIDLSALSVSAIVKGYGYTTPSYSFNFRGTYEKDGVIYSEFYYERSGDVGISIIFPEGEILDVTFNVTVKGESSVLKYKVPVRKDLLGLVKS